MAVTGPRKTGGKLGQARPDKPAKRPAKGRSGRLVPSNSVARALAEVGDRWSLMILGAAFGGVHRFTDWRLHLGIASNILTNRLGQLVAIGCLEKLPAQSGKRFVYHLTEKGRGLYPVALMFWRFDRAWSKRRPLQSGNLVHQTCGQVMEPKLVCAHCRAPVHAREVQYVKGPGSRMVERPSPPSSSRRSSIAAQDKAAMSGLFGESIDIFGDRWTQLIIGIFFLGQRRFEDIRATWHIATNILSDRLKLLVEHGILQKRIYQINPERSEYLLTPKGMGIYPIMLTLNKWGDDWLARGRPPLLLLHRDCGKPLVPIAVCSHCDQQMHCHEGSFAARNGR